MFKQLLEQSRTAAKMMTGMIQPKDIREYFEVLVDMNHDFSVNLADAGDKYFQDIKKLGPKVK